MRRWIVGIGFLGLGALNWAALHDIVKGETDVSAEWTVVVASAALVLALLGRSWRRAHPAR